MSLSIASGVGVWGQRCKLDSRLQRVVQEYAKEDQMVGKARAVRQQSKDWIMVKDWQEIGRGLKDKRKTED